VPCVVDITEVKTDVETLQNDSCLCLNGGQQLLLLLLANYELLWYMFHQLMV